ncbi:MAG: oligosaccharide flippase family protein [Mastigocoleus sp. MO_167.B18]|nr:oligosaccharide flippase family protein [Mastigocoleus sp. MO_167.B18]
MNRKPLAKRLASGTFWSLLATIFLKASNLIASILIARLLGQKSFGELSMINTTILALGNFAGFGLSMTTTKYVAELRLSDPQRTGKVLGLCYTIAIILGAFFSLGMLISSSHLAISVLNAPELINELRFGCLLLFLNAINEIKIATLSGFEAFKILAKVNSASSLINLLLSILGGWLYGLKGVIFAMIIVSLVKNIFYNYALKSEYKKHNIKIIYSKLIFQEIKIINKFTLPSFLTKILVAPVVWLGSTFLVHQPNGYIEIAAFNAANEYRSLLLFLPIVMGRTSLPILSSIISEKNKKSVVEALMITVSTSILIILPIAICMAIFSEKLMLLYGSEFSKYSSTLIIMLIGLSINGITVPIGNLITASGKMWLAFLMNLGWSVVFIGCTWIFLQQGLGGFGLALSYMAAYILHSLWVTFYGIKTLYSM